MFWLIVINFKKLKDCVVTNKNVIVRVDLNVPIHNGVIKDKTRINAVIPTIRYLVENNAKVILISHIGRPKGRIVPEMSLIKVVDDIQKFFPSTKVSFIDDCIGSKVIDAVDKINYGEIILLENLRFYKQETNNDKEFALQLAGLGTLYVNDAFSCSHRSHASIELMPKLLNGCAGFLLENELNNLQLLINDSKKPVFSIVGGAKISTKIELLKNLSKKSDALFIAGAMANTFLYALGYNIGKSLCEENLKIVALDIIAEAKRNNCKIILPEDVAVCSELKHKTSYNVVDVKKIGNNDIIADIGYKTIDSLSKTLSLYRTLIWNGPLGAFEFKPFDNGTNSLIEIVSKLTKDKKLISVVGGGDIVYAINNSNINVDISYISVSGGAFLDWLGDEELPGIKSLKETLKL